MGTVTTGATPGLGRGNSSKFDYIEPVESASSVSTPVEPFASDALGDTVIRAKVSSVLLLLHTVHGLHLLHAVSYSF